LNYFKKMRNRAKLFIQNIKHPSIQSFNCMFCQKCGKENPDTCQFCWICGEPLTKTSPDDTQKKPVYAPIVPLILTGIIIILALYLVPIGGEPIARRADLCSSPSFLFYNCPEGISWVLFLGWLLGVTCILAGILSWKKQ